MEKFVEKFGKRVNMAEEKMYIETTPKSYLELPVRPADWPTSIVGGPAGTYIRV